jgi:hypothetical protein
MQSVRYVTNLNHGAHVDMITSCAAHFKSVSGTHGDRRGHPAAPLQDRRPLGLSRKPRLLDRLLRLASSTASTCRAAVPVNADRDQHYLADNQPGLAWSHKVGRYRYSSPQSPITWVRSRAFARTASIMARSPGSSLKPKTRVFSAICCATPSRAPTITPATAGRSRM